MKRLLSPLVLVIVGALIGTAPAHAAERKNPKLGGSITVSAAASLTDAFTKMGKDFQQRNKGTTVRFNFAASSTLVQQIQGGAPADVFASADGANMLKLVSGGQVAGKPVDFAANLLTIVVKRGNPEHVTSLGDLPRLGTVSLCAPTVPCGKYAAQALAQDGVTIPSDRITLGQDVRAALAAVETGDADAGIVYVTDAKSAGSNVESVKIPASLNVLAVYPIARLASSQNPRLAKAWVQYVTSPAGQKTLRSFGFLAAPTRT